MPRKPVPEDLKRIKFSVAFQPSIIDKADQLAQQWGVTRSMAIERCVREQGGGK